MWKRHGSVHVVSATSTHRTCQHDWPGSILGHLAVIPHTIALASVLSRNGISWLDLDERAEERTCVARLLLSSKMSNNPFRQSNGEAYTNGSSNASLNGSGVEYGLKDGKSMGGLVAGGEQYRYSGTLNGSDENTQQHDHNNTMHQENGSGSRLVNTAHVAQSLNGNSTVLPPDTTQALQLHNHHSPAVMPPRHAHIPSLSRIRKESLPDSSPPYVRALSSYIAESVAPQTTPGDAHAEALRRLGKAERTVKTLKRRGSNESLSSLISYSIRRPSISSVPKTSGYSLDALAHVLEDAAQEGNLALVEALMALGANPNFRSVNRLKNRRHEALNKATAAGHVEVIDYLLRQGATFNLGEGKKKDEFEPIDYKLLDVAYSGYGDVARYLIEKQAANPFTEQWPRDYFDTKRTVYRRVVPARVYQRTALDAVARTGKEEQDAELMKHIMADPKFDPTATASRIYTDTPYTGDGTRMVQITYHYSALSTFIKAGWADVVESMLAINPNPSAYQIPDKVTTEEGQIPSTSIDRHVWPAHALTKDTWLYQPNSALHILKLLIDHGFDTRTAQRTADDSASRTPLSRCILANSPSGVQALLLAQPNLTKEEISFRLLLPSSGFAEHTAQPLAASLAQGSLDCARLLLRHGATPYDPAFNYTNVMMFAAGHGVAAILPDFIEVAPELLGEALDKAVRKCRVDAVRVLLQSSGKLEGLGLWDMVLTCDSVGKDDGTARYVRIMDMVHETGVKQRPSRDAVRTAVERENIVGVRTLMGWELLSVQDVGVMCQDMKRGRDWSDMLAQYDKEYKV